MDVRKIMCLNKKSQTKMITVPMDFGEIGGHVKVERLSEKEIKVTVLNLE